MLEIIYSMEAWILACLLCVVGLIAGYFFQPSNKEAVLYLDLDSRKGVELEIEENLSHSITCKEKDNMPAKTFFKVQPSFIVKIKRKFKELYLGVTGWIFTVSTEFPELKSVTDYLIHLAKGKDNYERMVQSGFRDTIKDNKIDLTVSLSPDKLTFKTPPDVTEDNFLVGESNKAVKDLHEGADSSRDLTLWQKAGYMSIGAVIVLLMFVFGVFD